MLSDFEIASQAQLKNISAVAADLDLKADELIPYGSHMAKLPAEKILAERHDRPDGQLVLVTATSPTPAGEGKTTQSIGLAQALARLGKKAIVALREPSLGPVFGLKGGAAGGGYSQVLPMEQINLHFTGDLHAITAANNLCAALLDNHLFQGNKLAIDPKRIVWQRCLDSNDRSLRHILINPTARPADPMREEHFRITAASEVMALFCLANSNQDLGRRLKELIVAYDQSGQAVTAADIGAAGAMHALLKDAFNPNLVQTLEGTPALIHGGPFANIAHGCSSIIATKLGLKLADILITEAGFGADLGAEKFLDITAPKAGFKPAAGVVVTTVRSLKYNGGQPSDELTKADLKALARGLSNLEKHLENLARFGLPALVVINCFPTDTAAERELIHACCQKHGVRCAESHAYSAGGDGATAAAGLLLELLKTEQACYQPLYQNDLPLEEKIKKVAIEIYGAAAVHFSPEAIQEMAVAKAAGADALPVCIAKTPYSFSDDPSRLGRPEGFTLTIRSMHINKGAGFTVCLTDRVLTMPGLPRHPAAEQIKVTPGGQITGLF